MDFVTLKELLTVVGIPGALVAAWRTVTVLINNNAERKRENRHKQAAVAYEILKETFANEKARAAMLMLDWDGRNYHDKERNLIHNISHYDLSMALVLDAVSFTEKECYIRDCFEDLFDRFELIQNYIDIDFIHAQDVVVPFSYYAKIITEKVRWFNAFLNGYGYRGAGKFIALASTYYVVQDDS